MYADKVILFVLKSNPNIKNNFHNLSRRWGQPKSLVNSGHVGCYLRDQSLDLDEFNLTKTNMEQQSLSKTPALSKVRK